MRKMIVLLVIASLLGCGKNTITEVEVIKKVETKSPLIFSATASSAIFASQNKGTGEAGVILFVKAYNDGAVTWYGYPELRTYVFIPSQDEPGDLVSSNRGIMTSEINSFGVPVPVDTLANEIPAFEIRRTLTFTPVDWNVYVDGVWIYWSFVENSLAKRAIQRKDFIYIAKP